MCRTQLYLPSGSHQIKLRFKQSQWRIITTHCICQEMGRVFEISGWFDSTDGDRRLESTFQASWTNYVTMEVHDDLDALTTFKFECSAWECALARGLCVHVQSVCAAFCLTQLYQRGKWGRIVSWADAMAILNFLLVVACWFIFEGSYRSMWVICFYLFCFLQSACRSSIRCFSRSGMYIAKCSWIHTFGDCHWGMMAGSKQAVADLGGPM